jgi:3-isopropylmalate/(R)-2-methylmalate dehydratase large subunit
VVEPRGARRSRWHGADLHRPPPGARSHQPAGLRGPEARRTQALARVDSIVATADHNTPTDHWDRGIEDPVSRLQVETLDANIREVGALAYFPFKDPRQGIVHVVGPESGATLPGMTVVCGDSHTSTHGAFACMAHGIGTSEVEHVTGHAMPAAEEVEDHAGAGRGHLGAGVTAKDVALAIIGRIGTAGGTGYAIEFAGSAIRGLSMEGRMTLCNMAIEAGARLGLIAVDEVTIDYLRAAPSLPPATCGNAPSPAGARLHSDDGAEFDCVVEIAGGGHPAAGHLGNVARDGRGGRFAAFPTRPSRKRSAVARRHGTCAALHGAAAELPIRDIRLDKIFIGSCTNSRIEDLRAAAAIVRGRKLASNIRLALVVPGSGLVKRQAESEGLDEIFVPPVSSGASRVARCAWR